MTVIAETTFELLDTGEKVLVRLFAPRVDEGTTWACRFEIGEPIGKGMDIYGEGSLQALALALQGLSTRLYSSEEWKAGRLVAEGGRPRSYLGIPASQYFLEEAPYPF